LSKNRSATPSPTVKEMARKQENQGGNSKVHRADNSDVGKKKHFSASFTGKREEGQREGGAKKVQGGKGSPPALGPRWRKTTANRTLGGGQKGGRTLIQKGGAFPQRANGNREKSGNRDWGREPSGPPSPRAITNLTVKETCGVGGREKQDKESF